MNYLKSLKDGKRRAVENVLEATGQSEKTVDENYEIDHEQYQQLLTFIQSSKSAVKNLLFSQRLYYENIFKHAEYLHNLSEQNNNPSNPSYQVIYLLAGEQCTQYYESINKLNNRHRPIIESILHHYTIQPLEDLITDITTNVNEVVKQRELYLIDYDSYRRRIKTCKEKIEKLQSTQPINQNKIDELQQELHKLQNKHSVAETNYHEYNTKAKNILKDSRRTILGFIEKHVITSLTCQAELCQHTAEQFNSILETIEPSQVDEIRLAIRETIGKDGNHRLPPQTTKTTATTTATPIVTTTATISHDSTYQEMDSFSPPIHHPQQQQHQHEVEIEEENLKDDHFLPALPSRPPPIPLTQPPALPSMPPPTVPLPPRPTQPPPPSSAFHEVDVTDDLIPTYAPPPPPTSTNPFFDD